MSSSPAESLRPVSLTINPVFLSELDVSSIDFRNVPSYDTDIGEFVWPALWLGGCSCDHWHKDSWEALERVLMIGSDDLGGVVN